MARKPENVFIAAIHRRLKEMHPQVYAEKTHNPFRGGVPDVYYEGPRGSAWVEYKWFDRVPRTVDLCGGKNPLLTALQQQWLDRSRGNGQNALVIIGFNMAGFPGGKAGVIFEGGWKTSTPGVTFIDRGLPLNSLVDCLAEFMG